MPITKLNTYEGVPLGKENFDEYMSYLLSLTARSNPFIESDSSDFNEIVVLGEGQTYALASSSDKEFSNSLIIDNVEIPNTFAYRHSIGTYDRTQQTGITANGDIDITPPSISDGENYFVRVAISLANPATDDRSADFSIQVNNVDVSQVFSFTSSDLATTRYIYHAIPGMLNTDTIELQVANISGSTGSITIDAVVYEYEDWNYNNSYVLNFDLLNPTFTTNTVTSLDIYFEDEAVFQSTDASTFTPIDTITISANNDSLGSFIFRPDSTDISASLIFSLREDSAAQAQVEISIDSFKLSNTNLITLAGNSTNSFAFLTDDQRELYALETYLLDGNYSTPDTDQWIIPLASIKEIDFGSGSTGYGFEKTDLPDSYNRLSSSDYESAKTNSLIGEYQTGFNLVSLNGIPQVDSSQTSSTGFYDTAKLISSDIFHLQSLRLGSEYPEPKYFLSENHQYASEVIEGFSYINSNTGSYGSSSLASLDYNNTLYFPFTDFLLNPSLILIHYDASDDVERYYFIPREENVLEDSVKANHYRVIDPSSGEVRFNFNIGLFSASDVGDKFWIVSAEQLPRNTTNNVTDYFSSYGSLYYPTANLNVDTKIIYFDQTLLLDTDLESTLPEARLIPSNKIISSGGGPIISDAEGEFTPFVLYGISYPGRVDVDQFVRMQANKYEPDVLSFTYYCGISGNELARDDKPYPTYIRLVQNNVSWYNLGINKLTYDPVSRATNSEICVVGVDIVDGSPVRPSNTARITDLQRRSSLSARSSTIDPSQTTFVSPSISSNSFLVTNSSTVISTVASPQGSILVGGAGGVPPTTLSIGSNGTFLTSNGTTPSWSTIDITDVNITPGALVSGLNAEYLNGSSDLYFLNVSTAFGGDVSGTYNNIVVSNDSHTHAFNNLTGKTSGTGDYSTTGNFSAARLISTATTGTSPLSVSSTTVVGNLNSDRLDGQHGSYFLTENSISGTSNEIEVQTAVASGGITPSGFDETRHIIGLPNNVIITSDLTVSGSITSTNDALINDVTVGKGSGNISTNTAFGFEALNSNAVGGVFNSAFGYKALLSNQTGTGNVAIGLDALRYSVSASNNVAVGQSAGTTVTTGSNLVLIGRDSEPSSATANNEITLGSSSITRFRIPGVGIDSSDTNLILSTGNTIIENSGKGIDFISTSGPASGTTSYRVLNDYQEGTWSPTYRTTLTQFSSITYDAQSGNYTKIGNVVYISGTISTSAISRGFASGNIYIDDLPFQPILGSGTAATIGRSSGFLGEHPSSGWISIGTLTPRLYLYYRSSSDGETLPLQQSDLDTGSSSNLIVFSAFYYTTA